MYNAPLIRGARFHWSVLPCGGRPTTIYATSHLCTCTSCWFSHTCMVLAGLVEFGSAAMRLFLVQMYFMWLKHALHKRMGTAKFSAMSQPMALGLRPTRAERQPRSAGALLQSPTNLPSGSGLGSGITCAGMPWHTASAGPPPKCNSSNAGRKSQRSYRARRRTHGEAHMTSMHTRPLESSHTHKHT